MSQQIKAPSLPKPEQKVEMKPIPKAEVKDFNKELDKAIAHSMEIYSRDHLRGQLETLKLQLEVKNLIGGK